MASTQQIHAMKEAHVKVAAICIPRYYVVFENGLVLPIQGFLDDDRQPTDDGSEMRYYEFGDDVHGYGTGDLDAYQMVSWEDH